MKKIMSIFPPALIVLMLAGCQKHADGGPGGGNTTDSFSVTVHNGYGGGKYKAGDTVNIFSKEVSNSQIFGGWSGDVAYLNTPTEWRSWFIMPEKNVSFTANIKSIAPFTLNYEMIKGKNIPKPVYSYFPKNPKGLVFLLHGTDGSAAALVSGFEYQEMITDLVGSGFGVIITECEESTLQKDLNGDGKYRWQTTPLDSVNNADYANIKIITDTFYNRGVISRSVPRFSIGMSDGGFFSTFLSHFYKYKCGVSYCSPASSIMLQNSVTPLLFCMQQWDDNPQVGATGNANALSDSKQLISQGVCSKYFINQPAPVYPERFARSSLFTVGLSQAVQAEMKAKGYLDNKNYFTGSWDDYYGAYQAHPSDFPVFDKLTGHQKQIVSEEVACSLTSHHIYSDHDFETIDFLENLCN